MDSKQDEREQLRAAIAALEVQRALLGDDVVDTTIAAMRERLAELTRQAPDAQHKQITVLVADLSGFTAMSEAMDAEEVRDTMDALWRRLDGLIAAWGGHIDQHLGDGLIALFGVPLAREDDPERAVLAALAMQEALRAFNRETAARPDLGMRIGVSTGRTLVAPASRGEGITALGETVSLAEQLEKAAPVGAVLICHQLFRHVSERFAITGAGTLPDSNRPIYRVTGGRPRQAPSSRREIEGVETRMIGRALEMSRLQEALQEACGPGPARAVTVVGEAGLGKSRLRHEFKQWLRNPQQPIHVPFLFESGAALQARRLPYALFRDLLSTFCGVHENDSPANARHKLVDRLAMVLRTGDAGTGHEGARRLAHLIGHLIGFDFSHSPHVQGIVEDARQVRQLAFTAVVRFFRALATGDPVLILLEDLHWADEGSLDLLLHLLHECEQGHLLLICFTRPSLFERRPEWQQLVHPGMFHTLITLEPLSPADSHRLIREILQKVPHVPADLSNLLAGSAEGNPFYLEEMIKVLIEDGAIAKEGERWQVRADRATLRVPTTLTGVLQARLDRLSLPERAMLQRAAVVGRLFWDTAVADLGANGTADLHTTLDALVDKELIFQRKKSLFAGSREYIFKHAVLREVTYESLLRQQRRVYHARVAEWLADHGGERVREYAGIIGEHYELAGDAAAAATWYGRAGRQARNSYTPETAIHYFRKALSFLAEGEDTLARQVEWYGGLGEMLRWQARFTEAVAALENMLRAAEAAGDLEGQARAWKALFLTHDYQGEHRAALESARGAEQVARIAGSQADLAMALSAKGWAMMYLGQEEGALELAAEALALSREAGNPREMAYSYILLGGVYRVMKQYEASLQATGKALELFRTLEDRIWEGLMLHNLGQTARLQGDYPAAINYYQQAAAIAREIGDRYGAMSALNRLGRVARLQGTYRQAATYQREALALAEKSDNKGRLAYIAHDLGDLHLAQALEGAPSGREVHLQQATRWLEKARQQGREAGQAVTEAAAMTGLARILLARDEVEEALAQAQEALQMGQMQVALWQGVAAQKVVGTVWWLLGQIATRLPEGEIEDAEGERYDPIACFEESLAVWDEIGSGVDWERARALRDLGAALLARGAEERGRRLMEEAAATFTALGMVQELARVEPTPTQQ